MDEGNRKVEDSLLNWKKPRPFESRDGVSFSKSISSQGWVPSRSLLYPISFLLNNVIVNSVTAAKSAAQTNDPTITSFPDNPRVADRLFATAYVLLFGIIKGPRCHPGPFSCFLCSLPPPSHLFKPPHSLSNGRMGAEKVHHSSAVERVHNEHVRGRRSGICHGDHLIAAL